MIKAVVFDCFGVLTEDAWLEFNKKYYGTEIYRIAHEYNDKSDHGLITDKVLYQKLAKLLGKTPDQVERIFTSEKKHIELFDYIGSDLKNKYKIGMLSNVNRGFLDKFLDDRERALFDSIIVSGELGIAKPHVGAYEAVLRSLSVGASEAIMIDDRPYNVVGAEKAGMKGILYKNFEQLKTDLEKMLADTKD